MPGSVPVGPPPVDTAMSTLVLAERAAMSLLYSPNKHKVFFSYETFFTEFSVCGTSDDPFPSSFMVLMYVFFARYNVTHNLPSDVYWSVFYIV